MRSILNVACMLILNISFSQSYFKFRFTDSSVPPPDHRSYSIDITETQVHLVIDSYGNILLDETYSINPEQYRDFVKKIIACKIKNKETNNDNGCTGGTDDSFSFSFPGSNKTFSGWVYHCGGKDYGNIKGNIAGAKDLFKSLVPDFSGKMESTRK